MEAHSEVERLGEARASEKAQEANRSEKEPVKTGERQGDLPGEREARANLIKSSCKPVSSSGAGDIAP